MKKFFFIYLLFQSILLFADNCKISNLIIQVPRNAQEDTDKVCFGSKGNFINILDNDDFGPAGPNTTNHIIIGSNTNEGGTISLANNSTPSNLLDDYILYDTPDGFSGIDRFSYTIIDANGDTDTTTVEIEIINTPGCTSIDAVDDPLTLDEDSADRSILVLSNDDFGIRGLRDNALTIVTPPTNGTARVDTGAIIDNPTDDVIFYKPAKDYFGPDSITYQICDLKGECDTAVISIMVTNLNDIPNALFDNFDNIKKNTSTLLNVIDNDNFGGDGPSNSPITIITNPSNGTAVVDDRGTFSDPTDDVIVYTPTTDFSGNDTLTYQICDIDGNCHFANVLIKVINGLPNAINDNFDLNEDALIAPLNVLSNDSFGDDGPSTSAITITVDPTNGNATVNNNATPNDPTDDVIMYMPNPNFFGDDTLTYQICDADGDCTTGIATIEIISDTSDTPIANNDPASVNEDTTDNQIDVLDNDTFGGDGPSNSAITITIAPNNGTATVNDNATPNDPTDDAILYTPNPDFFGDDTLTYEICDLNNDCTTAVINIRVDNDTTDTPTAIDDPISVNEDSTDNPIDVLDNDTFGGDGPSNSAITITIAPTNGTATVNDNATPNDPTDDAILYTPNPDFFGDDTLTYEICDLNNDCTTAVINIRVDNDTTDTPAAIDDPISVNEDSTDNPIDVLDNDTFGGDGPGTTAIAITIAPTNGTATVNNNATPNDPTDDVILYTPNPNFFGDDTVTYEICDLNNDCTTAVINIRVDNDTTDTPTAIDDPVSVNEDTTDNQIDVLDNDTFGGDGPSNSAITITIAPTNGNATVIDNATPNDPTDDVIVYTPNPNFFGDDILTYQICDADGDCTTAVINIRVDNDTTDMPAAIDDPVSVNEDTTDNPIDVLDNDSFGGDGPSTTAIVIMVTPTNGTASVNTNGTPNDPTDDTILYTPNPNFFGDDTLTYQICDADDDCITAVVNITVNNNTFDTPVAVEDSTDIEEDTTDNPIDILNNDSFGGDGPNNSAITITIAPTNGSATVNDNTTPNDPTDDTILYTPNPNFFGNDTLTYQICDADGDCTTAVVNITVNNNTFDTPVAIEDNIIINESTTSNQIDVLGNDSFGGDGPNDTAITIIDLPINGIATVNTNSTPDDPTDDSILYTPNPNFFGDDTITYQICDQNNDCAIAVVSITVNQINDNNPKISLLKTGRYVDINNNSTLNVGDIIEYTFTIINTGDEILTDITVTDLLAGVNLTGSSFTLAPGEENDTNFSAIYTITAADITNGQVINQAMVIATTPTGNSISDDSDDPNILADIDLNDDGEPDDPTVVKFEDQPENDVIVYETFTPNGDAVNDEFVIKNLENFPQNNLKIFNRWGLKVFEEDAYGQPNSLKFSGQSQGRLTIKQSDQLPTGTYFYTLNYINSNGNSKTKAGSFYLVK